MQEATYLTDRAYDGFRYGYAVILLKEILTTPGHKDEAIAAQFMAAIDERLGMVELVFPESIRGQEPPEGYFGMVESAFEVPAE